MAYDNLTNAQLAGELRALTNEAKNALGRGVARNDELIRRLGASTPPPPPPVPASPIDLGFATKPPPLPDLLVSPAADFGDVSGWTGPGPMPGQASITGDAVGAFRLTAQVTHVSNADSLVFPGDPRPRNHHHTYWGNPLSDENSTYESLCKAGVGSGEGGALNRSSKWMQSLLTYDKRVCIPDFVTEYYKQIPAQSGAWYQSLSAADKAALDAHRPRIVDASGRDTGRFAETVPLPAGLRYIVGNIIPDAPRALWHVYDSAENLLHYSTEMAECLARMVQGQTFYLTAEFNSPSGWDGKRVRTGDHHSHMAYVKWSPNGYPCLPETHPFLVPAIALKPRWRFTPEMGDPKKLFLSSDVLAPGDMAHIEYMEAWHRPTLLAWHDNCINKLANSASGILGDGRMLKQPPCFTFSVANNCISTDASGFARLIDANGNRL